MATQPNAVKAPKADKPVVALNVKVQDQLSKAVLSKKITKAELQSLATHIEKLVSFLDV